MDSAVKQQMDDLTQRLRERGVVDVKFFKTPEFYKLSEAERARDISDVIEAVLDGRFKPAEPFGDSVRGLLGGDSTSPITLSPVTRCGGESDTGDHNEEQQKGGTTAP